MNKSTVVLIMLLATACGDRNADPPPPPTQAAPTAEGPAGVAAVTWSPELDVQLDSMSQTDEGVYVRDVREGRGRTAEHGSAVTVEYRAWLPDGTLFEQRPSAEGFGLSEFVLGESEPVPGLLHGMVGMRTGGVRRIVVPAEHGYGIVGRPAGVPAGSALLFEVRLVGVDS